MRSASSLIALSILALAACASVSTEIVPYNPAVQYPPTQAVEVLLEKPTRPYVEIGLIEARGGSEAELLNRAREKAGALGAHAIVKLGLERIEHPPVAIYDPWSDPFYWGYYRHWPYPPYFSPWGPPRYMGGGFSYVLKVTAIRYTEPPPVT